MEPVELTLRDLAADAPVVVEARVSRPARDVVAQHTDDPCGGYVVEVYHLDVLTVRKAPKGVTVPAHLDAFEPVGWLAGETQRAACVGATPPAEEPARYRTPVPWASDREVVVLLSVDGDRWSLAAQGAWDDINRADKVARWAGVPNGD